jgi:hypothetical protein
MASCLADEALQMVSWALDCCEARAASRPETQARKMMGEMVLEELVILA